MAPSSTCWERNTTLIRTRVTWAAFTSSQMLYPMSSSSVHHSVASLMLRCHIRSCSTSERVSNSSTSQLVLVWLTKTISPLISTTFRSQVARMSCLTTPRTTSPRSLLREGLTPRRLRRLPRSLRRHLQHSLSRQETKPLRRAKGRKRQIWSKPWRRCRQA